MWTYDAFPSEAVKRAYGFAPTQSWLDSIRLASVWRICQLYKYRRFQDVRLAFAKEGELVFVSGHLGAPSARARWPSWSSSGM